MTRTTTRKRRLLLLTAALGHLGLVVVGALDICLWETGLPGRVLTYYAALSGADSGYSFFAPSVSTPPRAEFTIVDDDGRERVETLETRVMREADIRVENLLEVFGHRRADDALRARIAVSWAAAMFTRHRDAESVLVDIVRDRPPSMAEVRRGVEHRRRSIFRARVVRPAAARPGGAP